MSLFSVTKQNALLPILKLPSVTVPKRSWGGIKWREMRGREEKLHDKVLSSSLSDKPLWGQWPQHIKSHAKWPSSNWLPARILFSLLKHVGKIRELLCYRSHILLILYKRWFKTILVQTQTIQIQYREAKFIFWLMTHPQNCQAFSLLTLLSLPPSLPGS